MEIGQFVFYAYINKKGEIKIQRSTIVKVTEQMLFIYPTLDNKGKLWKTTNTADTPRKAVKHLAERLQEEKNKLAEKLKKLETSIISVNETEKMTSDEIEFNKKWEKPNKNQS